MKRMKRGQFQRQMPILADGQQARPEQPDEAAPATPLEPLSASQEPAKLLLRPLEAATALGVGRTTVYELMRAGELPVVHIGRAARILWHALESWVERQADASHGM